MPGVRSNNIYVVDSVTDPQSPSLHKIIDGDEIKAKTNLSAPHTIHCLGSDIIISMLGDAKGEAPGGFLHLNEDFEIVGRWENDLGGMKFNYDFWYQPRHNVMVSSEWAAPNTFMPGFDLEEVGHLKYGRRLHVWDFEKRRADTDDLPGRGRSGAAGGPVSSRSGQHSRLLLRGAVLEHHPLRKDEDDEEWKWEKIVDVENELHPEWPIPLPGVMSVMLVSMDDRYLYVNNWLHGDMRQYDITDPHNPVFTGQVWMGGLLGKAPEVNGAEVAGGPQMFQLSLDGKRLYVTTSLFSTWDNQFYPEIRTKGGCHGDDRLRHRERRNEDQRGLHRRLRQGAQRPSPLPRNPLSRWRLHERHLALMANLDDHVANQGGGDLRGRCATARCSRRSKSTAWTLPYGCRYGGCITCAAKVLAGEVDQSEQVALNNRQLADGYVLLCVARPTSRLHAGSRGRQSRQALPQSVPRPARPTRAQARHRTAPPEDTGVRG